MAGLWAGWVGIVLASGCFGGLDVFERPRDDPDGTDTGEECSPPCAPVCGDGRIEGEEECDDGGVLDGDGCSSTCAREPVCGDGVVEGFEACDGGTCCTPECTWGSVDIAVARTGQIASSPTTQTITATCDDAEVTLASPIWTDVATVTCTCHAMIDVFCWDNSGRVLVSIREVGGDGEFADCSQESTCSATFTTDVTEMIVCEWDAE